MQTFESLIHTVDTEFARRGKVGISLRPDVDSLVYQWGDATYNQSLHFVPSKSDGCLDIALVTTVVNGNQEWQSINRFPGVDEVISTEDKLTFSSHGKSLCMVYNDGMLAYFLSSKSA